MDLFAESRKKELTEKFATTLWDIWNNHHYHIYLDKIAIPRPATFDSLAEYDRKRKLYDLCELNSAYGSGMLDDDELFNIYIAMCCRIIQRSFRKYRVRRTISSLKEISFDSFLKEL